MPQNNQSITSSPEFKQFCKEKNLEVFNQEAVNVFLFELYTNKQENINGFFDHDKRIYALEEEIKKLK